MDAVARSMNALGGFRAEPRWIPPNVINRHSVILAGQIRWATLRWGLCACAVVISTAVLLTAPSSSFDCSESPSVPLLIHAWIVGATIRIGGGAACRLVLLAAWDVRRPPADQHRGLWTLLRIEGWLNLVALLWVTIGILFLYSPSLPCHTSPLVLYCRLVSVGLAVHMLWGFLANLLLWAARHTRARWLAAGVLWLSGASTDGLWERAGLVTAARVGGAAGLGEAALAAHAAAAGMTVAQLQEAMRREGGGGAQQPAFGRAWLMQPGAGASLSAADIAALPTFIFTAPPQPLPHQRQPKQAADAAAADPDAAAAGAAEGSSGREGGGSYIGSGEATYAMEPPSPPPLFASPGECGFPEGVVPDSACAVCQCDYEGGDTLRVLPCGGPGGARHAFHRACADTWLTMQATCPVCRARISAAATFVVAAATAAAATAATAVPQQPPPPRAAAGDGYAAAAAETPSPVPPLASAGATQHADSAGGRIIVAVAPASESGSSSGAV